MISRKKIDGRKRRHWHIRKRVSGTAARPRMNIYKSLKHIYVQLIDDESGTTLVSASTMTKDFAESGTKSTNKDGAAIVGKQAAELAIAAGITEVVFDRGGFRFHGRVKSLADAAREAGLKF